MEDVHPQNDEQEQPPAKLFYHERKVIDYFFEFFMLFLAVTLGFFVNNLSNDQAERKIEKQYMVSLVNDLKSDTLSIREVSEGIIMNMSGIDSIIRMIRNPELMKDGSRFYNLSNRYLNFASFFTSADRTISQLKFSGGMRLIRRSDVSDSIMNYYASSDNVAYNTDYCLEEFGRILDLRKDLLKFRYLTEKVPDKAGGVENGFIVNDPVRYNRLCNEIIFYRSLLYYYNELIIDLRDQADTLITFINESYSLPEKHNKNGRLI